MTSHEASLPGIDETLVQFDKVLASDVKSSNRPHPFGDLFAVCQMAAVQFGLPDVPSGGTHRLGASLDELATAFGLIVREVSLPGDWWTHDIGTAICISTDSSPPLLLRSNLQRGGMEYCSPRQQGKFHAVTKELAADLPATAYALYPALPDAPVSLVSIMKGVLILHPLETGIFLALTALVALLAYAVPVASGLVIDHAVPHRELRLLATIVFVVVGCNVLMLVLRYTAEMVAQRLEGSMGVHVQAGTLERMFRLPLNFFSQQNSVALMRRYSGLESARRALLRMLVTSLLDIITLLVGFGLLAFYFPLGALVVAVTACISLALAYWLGKLSFSAYSQGEAMSVNLLTIVHEMIANMLTIRVFSAQRRLFSRWRDSFIEMRRRIVRSSRYNIVFSACQQAINLVSLSIIFAIITYSTSATAAKPVGYYVAFVGSLSLITGSVLSLASSILASFSIKTMVIRATGILTAVPEKPHGRMRLGLLKGAIELVDVDFRYSDSGPAVLHDFSLSIAPGQYIGIIGSSGCGKSTLVKLMIGLTSPSKGKILLDGNSLQDFDADHARQQIGLVLQDYRMVSGSVLENVLANRIFSDDEVLSILNKVGIGEYIASLPMGLHTLISEDTSTFSAGQIQLIALARALIGEPKMLIFDEATSALDNMSVERIGAVLDDLKITRVVFTHRINTLKNCDQVYVMGQGQIVQQGTYADLANTEGLFKAMLNGNIG